MASVLYVDDIYLAGKIGLPLGFVYTQLPGTPDPDDLFTGTWENVSATFAGDFFRAEGGDASAFAAGEQADQMQRITGEMVTLGNRAIFASGAGTGALFSDLNQTVAGAGSSSGYGGNIKLDSADSPDARTSTSTDGETRPINHTVRLWKRTA